MPGVWEKEPKKPCSHLGRPELPSYYGENTKHMVGGVWRCDCGMRFEIDTYKTKEGPQWDIYEVTKLRWVALTQSVQVGAKIVWDNA